MNNSIWGGKSISVNTYRHLYITSFYSGQTPTLLQMEELAKYMGQSVQQSLLYVKNDLPTTDNEKTNINLKN